MSDLSSGPPPDPVVGEPGVFDYIDWLKTSILELDAAKARALDVLAKAGGTMTGPLTLSGNPTATNHAATKAYVDGLESASFNLVPSWRAYGGTYSTILLQKSADKMVTLEGLITPVTPSVAVGAGATITVGSLPAGYAPATQILIPALMADHSSTIAITTRIQISVNGDMIFNIPRDAPSINWVSISCSFRAA